MLSLIPPSLHPQSTLFFSHLSTPIYFRPLFIPMRFVFPKFPLVTSLLQHLPGLPLTQWIRSRFLRSPCTVYSLQTHLPLPYTTPTAPSSLPSTPPRQAVQPSLSCKLHCSDTQKSYQWERSVPSQK